MPFGPDHKILEVLSENYWRVDSAPRLPRLPVQIKLLSDLAEVPTPAKPGDAGLDLRATTSALLWPRQRRKMGTHIALAIPQGYAGFVLPRSGLAFQHGLTVVNAPGLIDSGYRGEVCVTLINHGQFEVSIAAGDRIAQLVILPVPVVEFQVVDSLPETERGEGGFGSTGA